MASCDRLPTTETLVQLDNKTLERRISEMGPSHRIETGNWVIKSVGNKVSSSVTSTDKSAELVIESAENPKNASPTSVVIKTSTGQGCILPRVFVQGRVWFDGKEDWSFTGITEHPHDEIKVFLMSFKTLFPYDSHDNVKFKLYDDCSNNYEFEFDIAGETHLRSLGVRQAKNLLNKRKNNSSCRIGDYC